MPVDNKLPRPRRPTGMWKYLQGGVAAVCSVALFAFIACSPSTHNVRKQAPQALIVQADWPQAASDLGADKDVIFSRLPNGVRYILKENKTPRDRVSMHLYVQVGSLCEADDEQGLAHLLEHMLFDGSKHFAPGEMVKFFQRIGMQFGPDANAHTGFNQTVFDINLPTGNSKSIAEGLLVLRDYADGALLLPQELEKEKKVILAEMRSRDSAAYRTLKSVFQFEMPDTIVPKRFPIGQEAIIRRIDSAKLRTFYDTWYRPERMILVMVGDFAADKAIPLIKEHFSDMHARTAAKPLPQFGNILHRGIQPFYHYNKDSGAVTVRIESILNKIQPPDSLAQQRKRLLSDLADQILQQRLNKIVQAKKSVLNSARIGSGYFLQQVKYAELEVESDPARWQQALSVTEQALRQALQFGFTPRELERAKKDMQAQLQREAKESRTLESTDVARRIMDSISDGYVFQSPQQRLDMLSPILAKISLSQVRQSFVQTWAAPHRLIAVTGNADLEKGKLSPQEQLLRAYHDSVKIAVKPPADKAVVKFPYLPKPQNLGQIATHRKVADTGIEQFTFSNGFQLFLKPTVFKEKQVLVGLSFGSGKASEPKDQPGLAELAEQVVNESGFGKLDHTELDEALAGHLARIDFEVREDMFVVKGDSITSELPLLMQLLYTFVEDPGYRSTARDLALKRYEQQYQSYSHSVNGALRLHGERFLAGGDSRFGMPALPQVQQRTLEQIKQWLGSQLRRAPLEMAVVGDFASQQVIDLAARYFGSLPPRDAPHQAAGRPSPTFPAHQSIQLNVPSAIPKSLVVVAYPTADFWDIQRTRRLNIMAEVLSERLRVNIREKLGAAYSPFAYNRPYRGYPGYGLLQVHVLVDPAKAQGIVSEVHQIADRMARQPISQDEFRRALDPTLTSIKDLRQTNAYWFNSVLIGAGRHPEQLDWCRTIEQDYAAIGSAEIAAYARKYLDNRKAATVIILPITKSEDPATSAVTSNWTVATNYIGAPVSTAEKAPKQK